MSMDISHDDNHVILTTLHPMGGGNFIRGRSYRLTRTEAEWLRDAFVSIRGRTKFEFTGHKQRNRQTGGMHP